MIKNFKILLAFILMGFLSSCSQVLQTVDLDINSKDNSVQEQFKVVEKTLTIKEARMLARAPYERMVLQSGGAAVKSIPEKIALSSEFPINSGPFKYTIGIGDTITFSKLIENNYTSIELDKQWPTKSKPSDYKLGVGDTLALTLIKENNATNQMVPKNDDGNQNLIINSQDIDLTINSNGRIGSDGSVLLLEVGRLEASDKSLNELRSEVRNILIRNGVSPRFQLEIVDFKSQKAYLTVNANPKLLYLMIKKQQCAIFSHQRMSVLNLE